MKQLIYISILLLIAFNLPAQIEFNKSLHFISTDSTKREIKNLAYPLDSNDAVNVKSIGYSYLEFYTSTGRNKISFNTNIGFDQYYEGMTFIFKVDSSNTDTVQINIDSKGWRPVIHSDFSLLRKGSLLSGNIVKVIYNGSKFILLNDGEKGCPNGFVEVNETYCIEINERSTWALFFDATNNCQDINGKICTWGEWYHACQKTGLGLLNMTNNYEFIDDGHDHANFIGMVGGVSSCNTFTSLSILTATRPYRCCYRK